MILTQIFKEDFYYRGSKSVFQLVREQSAKTEVKVVNKTNAKVKFVRTDGEIITPNDYPEGTIIFRSDDNSLYYSLGDKIEKFGETLDKLTVKLDYRNDQNHPDLISTIKINSRS